MRPWLYPANPVPYLDRESPQGMGVFLPADLSCAKHARYAKRALRSELSRA